MEGKNTCQYTFIESAYTTSCGSLLSVHNYSHDEHGLLEDNDFEYCPYCGKTIEEIKE